MDEVYVVIARDWEDDLIWGIFSTRESAEETFARISGDAHYRRHSLKIERWPLNPSHDQLGKHTKIAQTESND